LNTKSLPLQLPNHSVLDYRRGILMIEFIRNRVGDFTGRRILDIGAGKGGIAAAFVDAGASVVCVDRDVTNCIRARKLHEQLGLNNSSEIVHSLAQNLPFEENCFNIVMMNGLLEWVGTNSKNPEAEQRKAIAEAARVLREDGALYLAIENRLFPAFLILDPHTHQLFVNLFPRRVARFLTRKARGGPFSTYIYSIWGLQKMLKDSFADRQVFYPLPHYHFPYQYGCANAKESLLDAIKVADRTPNMPLKLKLTLFYAKIVTTLHLNRFILPYLVVLARKEGPG